jgi:polygalacturonase
MLLSALLFVLLILTSTAYALPAINTRQYGATGNGTTLDSPAIQRAIDAASVHGGTVTVPAGTYLNVILKTADGSKVSLADSERVTGLATIPGVDLPRQDPAKKPFAEQDQN